MAGFGVGAAVETMVLVYGEPIAIAKQKVIGIELDTFSKVNLQHVHDNLFTHRAAGNAYSQLYSSLQHEGPIPVITSP